MDEIDDVCYYLLHMDPTWVPKETLSTCPCFSTYMLPGTTAVKEEPIECTGDSGSYPSDVVAMQCNYCNETYFDSNKLYLHMNICGNSVGSSAGSVVSSVGSVGSSVGSVGSSVGSEDNKNISKCSVSKRKQYKCEFCPKSFTVATNLRNHVRVHTGERPFKCTWCTKEFTERVRLVVHTRVHTGEKPFTCSLCLKAFTVKGNLDKHIRVHTREKPYACVLCVRAFAEKGNLTRHVKHVHASARVKRCQGEGENNNSGKKKQSEVGVKRCRISSQTQAARVGEKSFVNTKQRRNARGKPVERPVTNAGTPRERIQLYRCELCHKHFTNKCSLIKHNRLHTGEKPFKCVRCTKTFNVKGNMAKHLRVHTGAKPYHCNVCPRVFADKSNLTRHRKKKHS